MKPKGHLSSASRVPERMEFEDQREAGEGGVRRSQNTPQIQYKYSWALFSINIGESPGAVNVKFASCKIPVLKYLQMRKISAICFSRSAKLFSSSWQILSHTRPPGFLIQTPGSQGWGRAFPAGERLLPVKGSVSDHLGVVSVFATPSEKTWE